MEGFVIQLVPDDDGTPTSYVNDTDGTVEDLNQANLFPDITSARQKVGQLQSTYTSYSVNALPATKGITLKSNVATSSTNTTASTI